VQHAALNPYYYGSRRRCCLSFATAAASAQGEDDDVGKAAFATNPQPVFSLSLSLDIELGILTGTRVAGECNFRANNLSNSRTNTLPALMTCSNICL